MMDSLNHRNADYIQDISMEISSAFYPPPMIVLPSIALPPLHKFNFEFKTEHEMIQKYREDQLRIKRIAEAKEKAEAEFKQREELTTASEQAAFDSPCSSCSTPPSAESSSSSQNTRSSSHNAEYDHARPPITPIFQVLNLNTRPSDNGTAETKSSQLEPSKPNQEIRKLQRFEEFEVASSVFDIVELRSLDDRKELEKLLNGL